MILITGPQLKLIAPSLSLQRAETIAGLLNETCPKYGMDTLDEFKEFLANIVQESGEFSAMVENMNYTAERLAQVWPHRFSISSKPPYLPNALAKSLHRKPVDIANNVYGGRMGNNQPNDGWDFRGGGPIGLTGREVYTKYGKHIGKDPVMAAQLVRTDLRYAIDSACWFFSVLKGLNDEAERDEWLKIVKSINGGTIGLSDRNRYMARVNQILPE
jgi:putative chitinase